MTTEALELAIARHLEHPPEDVFRALTEREIYALWMGPEGSKTTIRELDARVGGRLSLEVDIPDGPTVGITGIYLEVSAPTLLEHTWLVEGDETETVVRFELHPDGGGTRLQLTHKGFADGEDRGRNEGGWNQQLDRLDAALARTNK